MPRRTTLSITSTRNAGALTLYAVFAVLGVLHVADFAPHIPVTDTIGDTWTELWALVFVLGPLCALVSAIVAPMFRVPVIPMWLEGAGCILAAVASSAYAWSMFKFYGLERAASIEVMFSGIALGLLFRFGQITHEQGKIRRARAHPQSANPPPLAEADSGG